MLIKTNLKQGQPHYYLGIRLLLVGLALPLLTSCTTLGPGLDRILFSNSSAKVGPLVTASEQYPMDDLVQDSATPETEATAEPSEVTTLVQKSVPEEPSANANLTAESQAVPEPNVVNNKPAPVKAQPQTVQSQNMPEIAIEYGAVTGKVVLVDDENNPLSATGTMITFTPKTMVDDEQDRPAEVHIIDMEDKTYMPRYSTIHAGDQVVFVNKDDIQHNVFSSSGNNAFDLGTYGAGLKRAVTLKEHGVVKIYCNIHPEMATFVAVGDQKLSVQTDDQGRYEIDELIPGAYEVAIWNIRGETKRMVEIKANQNAQLVDRIDTTAFKVEPHKNKFGGNYSKNSTLFEDEFY